MHSLKYKRFMRSGYNDLGIRKLGFVTLYILILTNLIIKKKIIQAIIIFSNIRFHYEKINKKIKKLMLYFCIRLFS